MRFSATTESVVLGGVVLLGVMALLVMSSCETGQAQTEGDAANPLVEFRSASLGGAVKVKTPAGLVSVDLETGLVGGDVAEAELVSLDAQASVDLRVNGAPQTVAIYTHGEGIPWAQCVTIRAVVGAMGIGLAISALPPGLPAACGKPYLEVVPVPLRVELGDYPLIE